MDIGDCDRAEIGRDAGDNECEPAANESDGILGAHSGHLRKVENWVLWSRVRTGRIVVE